MGELIRTSALSSPMKSVVWFHYSSGGAFVTALPRLFGIREAYQNVKIFVS